MSNKKYLLLDCNYLCHRVKHSMGGLSYGGTPTGVIYGFLKYIPALQSLFNTPHIVFCWDSKTNKRKEIYPFYKSNREDRYKKLTKEEKKFEAEFRIQMKKLRKIYLRKIGFRNVFCQKGYESDDLIASICKSLQLGNEAVIVSSDQDLYQLIRHNISFYNPQTNKILTPQGFKKKYGIVAAEWVMVKSLAGCHTDGIPGLTGIGEKTAIKFLLGKLTSPSKLKIIVSGISTKTYRQNAVLIRLPFLGTKKFRLRRDEISEEGWDEVTETLGMNSIRDKIPFGSRRKKKKKRTKMGKKGLF